MSAPPAVYGTSALKGQRRTNAELAELDLLNFKVCEGEHPATVRRVFYLLVPRGAVPRDDVAAALAEILHAPATVGTSLGLTSGDTPVAEAVASPE